MVFEFLKDHMPWAIPVIAFIGWLFRLESRSTSNTKDLSKLEVRLEKQRAEDMASRQRDWDSINSTLSEMRSDIKTLLQRNVGG